MENTAHNQQEHINALFSTPYIGVQNCMTARFTKSKGRKIKGLSMTVPDQTMSLREILQRFSRGLPISGNNMQPEYQDEDGSYMGIDFRTLDLAERMDIIKGYSEAITAHQNHVKEVASKNAREALKAQIKAEFEADLAKQKDPLLTDKEKIA